MRYLTLVTTVDKADEKSSKQYALGIKCWKGHAFVNDMLLSVTVTGDIVSKRNVVRELTAVCGEINLPYIVEWKHGKTKAAALNEALHSADTIYVGTLPFNGWREPFGVGNQISVLRTVGDLTYGDFVIAPDLSKVFENINLLTTLEKTNNSVIKNYRSNKWGEFLMWKKLLHTRLQYLDEKLLKSSEFDFINRIMSNDRLRLVKTAGIMGAVTGMPERDMKEEIEIAEKFEQKKVTMVTNFGKEVEWRI